MVKTRGWQIENAPGVDQQTLERAALLLDASEQGRKNASASASGFQVGSAIDIGSSRIYQGCNIEYGAGLGQAETRSLHSEQTVIANAVSAIGPNFTIELVAVTADGAEPVTSCGNCLDMIRTFGTEQTIWVSGCSAGKAQLLTMEQVFPEEFSVVDQSGLRSNLIQLVKQARVSATRGSFIFSGETLGPTGAAVLTDSGSTYIGAREDSAAYHPVSAVECAIASARAANDPWVKAIAVVSESGSIHGRDRQKIFEKADELERVDSLNVLLVPLSPKGKVRLATPEALLPFGFGARSIGLIEEVRASLKRYPGGRR